MNEDNNKKNVKQLNNLTSESLEKNNFEPMDSKIDDKIAEHIDEKIQKIQKILKLYEIPNDKPPLKSIFEKYDNKFNNEYLTFNKIYCKTKCYIKIGNKYELGKIRVFNKEIFVEKEQRIEKLKEASISDISYNEVKNKSSQVEIPNYVLNDSIDNIIKGNNINNGINKDIPAYLFIINLDLVTCKLIISKQKQKFQLLILGHRYNNSDKIYPIKIIKFNCLNLGKNAFFNLCEMINKSIILSDGYKKNIFGINLMKNYYYKRFISVYKFVSEANTCDLLIVTNHNSSKNYENVFLLIKNNFELKICYYTETEGYILGDFTQLIEERLNYGVVIYRKLYINIENMVEYIHNENENKLEVLDNYHVNNMSVNEIKNKFYQILNKKVKIFIENNKLLSLQLVPSIYIYCCIIKKNMDTINYLPSDFSDKNKIDF